MRFGMLGGCLLAEDEQKFPANQSHFKALQHYHFEEGFFSPSSPKVQNGESLGFQRPAKKLLRLEKKVDRLLDVRIQTGIPPVPWERLSDKDIFSESTSHASNQINWASRTLLSGSCHLTTPVVKKELVLTHHFIAWKYPRLRQWLVTL